MSPNKEEKGEHCFVFDRLGIRRVYIYTNKDNQTTGDMHHLSK